jgi:CubicO group peptidase (beta-lactamase class C family)
LFQSLKNAQRRDYLHRPLFGDKMTRSRNNDVGAWIGPATVGSFGWPGAFGTWWFADPSENIVMLYLVQSLVPPTPENDPRFVFGTGTPWPTFQTLTYAALGR